NPTLPQVYGCNSVRMQQCTDATQLLLRLETRCPHHVAPAGGVILDLACEFLTRRRGHAQPGVLERRPHRRCDTWLRPSPRTLSVFEIARVEIRQKAGLCWAPSELFACSRPRRRWLRCLS